MNHYQHPKTKEVRAFNPKLQADLIEKSLAEGFELMDEKAFEAFRNPPKTPAQLLVELSAAVQSHLDTTAQGYRYDGILSAVSYADDGTQFGKQGAAFKAWRSAVWQAAGEIEYQVSAGKRGIPMPAELIAELPAFKA